MKTVESDHGLILLFAGELGAGDGTEKKTRPASRQVRLIYGDDDFNIDCVTGQRAAELESFFAKKFLLLLPQRLGKDSVQLGWLILVESEFLCICFDILL